MKIIILILISLLVLETKVSFGKVESFKMSQNESICLIQNIQYKNEYLFSSVEFDPYDLDEIDSESHDHHNQPSTPHKKDFNYFKHKLFTNVIKYQHQFRKSFWILRSVDWMENTFYISSLYYDDYHICATHKHADKFYYRRKINLVKLNKESLATNQKCMWKFEALSNSSNTNYHIWNINYEEPLYSVSFLLKSARSKNRFVYTWHKSPDSKQFNWNLNCFKSN